MYDNNLISLLSISESIDKIIEFSKSFHNPEEFNEDVKTFDAVMMNFVIIGEQTQKLSLDFKDKHTEIEWDKIKAFRNIVAHDYFGIDADEVWGIIQKHIPILKTKIDNLITEIK
ncbi:MAG: HepT-like ribonuclease domain-containing protein [Bacteroidota bacterium]|nr:HepT-like ribonuclease domain-containing protein [Bacteroidota bacterium]